jgi:restriction endonuclease Mrr
VAVPDFQSVMLPFLETLQDGRERTMREVTETLAVRLNLTDEERQERLPSGQQTLFSNRVAWAKSHLKMPVLSSTPHGARSAYRKQAGRFDTFSRRRRSPWLLVWPKWPQERT